MTSPKYVRLIDEAGKGPAIGLFRGRTSPSKSAAVLAKAFRVRELRGRSGGRNAAKPSRELASALEGMKVTHAGNCR